MKNTLSIKSRFLRIIVACIFVGFAQTSFAVPIDTTGYQNIVDSLIRLSDSNFDNDDLAGCIMERQNAVSYLKKLKDWENLVKQFNTLYVAHDFADDKIGVEKYLDSALSYSLEYLPEHDINRIDALANQGQYELKKSNFTKSINFLERALEGYDLIEAPFGMLFPPLSNYLIACRLKGEIELSNSTGWAYLKRLKLSDSDYNLYVTRLLLLIGVNEYENSNYLQSIETFEKAKKINEKISESNKQEYLWYRTDLAFCLANNYLAIEQPKKSIDLMKQIDISELYLYRVESEYNHKLGKYWFELGEFNKAVSFGKEAFEIHAKRKISQTKKLAIYSSFIGGCYLETNQLDSARHYLELSVGYLNIQHDDKFRDYSNFIKIKDFNKNTVKVLAKWAEANRFMFNITKDISNLNKSLSCYRQAFNGAKFLQKELTSKHSKYILNKNLQEHYPAYLSLLLEMYSEEPSSETFQEILQLIEDNKAVVLKEDIQEKLAITSSSIPEELLKKEDEFKEELNTLKRKIHDFKPKEEGDEAIVNKWKEEQLQITRAYTDHQKYLEDNYPAYFKAKYEIQTIDLTELKEDLGKEEAFLSFYETEEKWYCAWVTREKEGIHSIEKTEETQTALTDVLRILRRNPLDNFVASDLATFKSSAFGLHQALLPAQIKDKASLIISQIGELNYLPFEVLLTNQKTEALDFGELPYLLKEKNIQYASSAELWLDSKKKQSNNTSLDAISFAPFTEGEETGERNCVADAKMSALACTQKELNYISDNITARSFFSQDASLANFEAMDSASIIHLATHACLDDADDAFNKLIFYDDYLSIQDLESMRLNADLAVLSACNTGSGKMKAGEGVIHLGKAFRAAGVSSLITSLWSINDCATADIVGNFYGKLKQNDISTALRSAKLDYLKDSNKLLAHPHFWAGLTFSGNSKVLSAKDSAPYLPYLIGCFAVILGFFYYRHRN